MHVSAQVPLTKNPEAQERPYNQKENSNYYKDSLLFWKTKQKNIYFQFVFYFFY